MTDGSIDSEIRECVTVSGNGYRIEKTRGALECVCMTLKWLKSENLSDDAACMLTGAITDLSKLYLEAIESYTGLTCWQIHSVELRNSLQDRPAECETILDNIEKQAFQNV